MPNDTQKMYISYIFFSHAEITVWKFIPETIVIKTTWTVFNFLQETLKIK